MQVQISPWGAIGLNIAYAALTGLTLPVVDAFGFVGHDTQIVAIAAFIAMPLNMLMHSVSSSQPGPLAPPDPPGVVAATLAAASKAALVLIAVLCLITLHLAPAFADAQVAAGESPTQFNTAGRLPRLPRAIETPVTLPATAAAAAPPATDDSVPCVDPANLLPIGCKPPTGASVGLGVPLADFLKQGLGYFNSDFVGAAALAAQIPELPDGNGQACFVKVGIIGKVLKIHPVPVTLKLATDFEAARLFTMALRQVCDFPQCTVVFTELSNGIQQIAPASLGQSPIPSLTQLCVHVPNIASVPIAAATTSPTAPAQ